MSNNELVERLTELGITIPSACFDDKGACLLKERLVCFEMDDKHHKTTPLANVLKNVATKAKIYIIICTEVIVKTKNKPLLISVLSESGEPINNIIPFSSLDNTTTLHNDVIMNSSSSQETRIWFKPFKSEEDKKILDKLNFNIPQGTSLNEYIVKDVTHSSDGKLAYVPVLSNFGKYINANPRFIKQGQCVKATATETHPERFEIDKSYYELLKPEFLSILTPNHINYSNLKNFSILGTVPKSSTEKDKDSTDKDKFYASFRIYIFYT